MRELIILCNPAGAYSGTEAEIAKAYTEAALGEYEAMADFKQGGGESDHVRVVGTKQGRDLTLSIYAQEKVTRMGGVRGDFATSSYLFNPASSDPEVEANADLCLPDLDVVTLRAETDELVAAQEVRAFYERHGWRVAIVESAGMLTTEKLTVPRLGPIEIFQPDALRQFAADYVGYDLKRLCF